MYVYSHKRKDTNEIFYIGIGTRKDRVYSSYDRNKFWKNIVNKTDYIVEIIYNNLDEKSAKELEIFLIKLYGRRNLKEGSLVNLTNGGEGTLGIKRIFSKKTREKLSLASKGRKQSKQWIQNKKLSNTKQIKKVINTDTNIIFNCVREASDHYNIKYSTLVAKLNGQNKNNTNLKYYANN